jgi:tyrosyl-tRNA synthetase
VLIVGDFTSMIGDPSGKSKTRPQLSREEIQANVDSVLGQIGAILEVEKTEIRFNDDWLGKMKFDEVIRLASRYTVARILERDDFTKRLTEQRPISMHEIMYPLCQGYDSVAIEADIELGGNDQKFNNLVGRTLMEQYSMAPQVVILSPLLVGTDGKEKMSQSLGNYIGVKDEPNDMYGKTMSIPDDILENYFELATDVPMDEVRALIKDTPNPRDVKRRLAREIVTLYHGVEAGQAADGYFVTTFSQRQQPVDAEEVSVPFELVVEGQVTLPSLIVALGLAKSNGDAKRLMQAGAVSLDAEKASDPSVRFLVDEMRGKVLKVGKHEFRRLV